MALDLTSVLLTQWDSAPRLKGIVDEVLVPMRDDALSSLARLQEMQDVDRAEGVWLDRIGLRLGVRRPFTADQTLVNYFGFDKAGVPFDASPFRGNQASELTFPLPDVHWRKLIKARGVTVYGDGTYRAFTVAAKHVDPSVTVSDNRDMTVSVTTSELTLIRLAHSYNCLPLPAGVAITFAEHSAERISWGAEEITWGTDKIEWGT